MNTKKVKSPALTKCKIRQVELSNDVWRLLATLAEKENHSIKSYMEKVLIDHVRGDNPVLNRQK